MSDRQITDDDAKAIADAFAANDPAARREAARRQVNEDIRGSLAAQRQRRFARLSRPEPPPNPALKVAEDMRKAAERETERARAESERAKAERAVAEAGT
jgi:hypothetical protein